MARRRQTNIFSLSLLDCITCGFGALILFHMIVAARAGGTFTDVTDALRSEVTMREEEVLEGQENLVEVRNSLREIERQRVITQGLSTRLLAMLREIEEELATYDQANIARREHINRLKSDLRSLEEGARRLSGGPPTEEVPGPNIRSFVGDGDRQYLSGLKVGGERIFILVDASASMLADDIVNAVRRGFLPDEVRMRADKWQQAVRAVDWLTTQIPRQSKYQIYVFDTRARPVLEGTDGVWLEARDAVRLGRAVAVLRQTAPIGGTSLHHAFAAAKAMNPPPDNIILLTDGLPTQGERPPRRKTISGKDRLRLLERSLDALPRRVPVNVILYPMEGDPMASPAFWKVAMATRGSMMTPSKDWP
ncbi:MAG: VWA domain-containing protein [Acidobacteriota bacterium]